MNRIALSKKSDSAEHPSQTAYVLKYIADSGKLVFSACTVNTVIDGDKVYAKLREKNIRIHTHLQIVAPESAHILYDDALDFTSLNIGKHMLEARTVK